MENIFPKCNRVALFYMFANFFNVCLSDGCILTFASLLFWFKKIKKNLTSYKSNGKRTEDSLRSLRDLSGVPLATLWELLP